MHIFFISFLLSIFLHTQELKDIMLAHPCLAIIPIYGDYKLKQVRSFLLNNQQALALKDNITYLNEKKIKKIRALNSDNQIHIDRQFIEQTLPTLNGHQKAMMICTFGCFFSLVILYGYFTLDTMTHYQNTGQEKKYELFWVQTSFIFFAYMFAFRYTFESEVNDYASTFTKMLANLKKHQ